MDKYEIKVKLDNLLQTTMTSFPKILKYILSFIGNIFYFIVLILTLVTNLLSLGLLYIGAGIALLGDKITNEK